MALRLVKDSPELVERLAVLDNVRARVLFQMMNGALARGQWWFLFNQVPNLPEALIAGREEVWLRHFFTTWSHDPQLVTPEDLAEYVRAYTQPGAVMCACNDYRAGQEDVAQDEEDKDQKVTCPVLALRGADLGREGLRRGRDLVGDRHRPTHGGAARLLSPAARGTPRARHRASARLPRRLAA